MKLTVTLMQGWLGWAIAIFAWYGAVRTGISVQDWLSDRLILDLNPYRVHWSQGGKWHITVPLFPRRLKVSHRWDRPGVIVTLADGREAVILYVVGDDDLPDMAAVQPYADEVAQEPEWAELDTSFPEPTVRPKVRAV